MLVYVSMRQKIYRQSRPEVDELGYCPESRVVRHSPRRELSSEIDALDSKIGIGENSSRVRRNSERRRTLQGQNPIETVVPKRFPQN